MYVVLSHENTFQEFDVLTQTLLDEVKKIVTSEPDATFLVVSEDPKWKQEIIDKINLSASHFVFLDDEWTHEYDNGATIRDLFSLSYCKEILQGVKYSTFSITASLLGEAGRLRNFAYLLPSAPICNIYAWSSVVDINGQKSFNPTVHVQSIGHHDYFSVSPPL